MPLPACGVSLFLILSGYGLSESFAKKGLSHYWSGKITRMLLPYAIVITVFILLTEEHYSFIRHLKEVTGWATTYWYIAYQLKWYIVFFFVSLVFTKYSIPAFFVFGILMFFTLGPLEAEQSLMFPLGVCLSRYKEKLTNASFGKNLMVTISAGAICLAAILLRQLPSIRDLLNQPPYIFIQMVQNLCLSVCVIFASILVPGLRKSRGLIYLGVVSYELYLLHFPFYVKVGGNFTLAFTLIIISSIAAGLFYKYNSFFAKRVNKRLNSILAL